MGSSVSVGTALTLVAGIMSGNCMLPMKFSRHWRFENLWLIFSFVSLIVLPWALALGLVDHLFATYRSLSLLQLAVPFLFGLGWGVAQVLFGVSVQRLGLGLAYAIIVGLGTLLGILVPLFTQHREQVTTFGLGGILAGIMVMIVGIVLTTGAGRIRELALKSTPKTTPTSGYVTAVLLAILCGLMAPMLNFSFAFGRDIERQAVALGNSEIHAAYAVWPIGLAGGCFSNLTYSLYLLRKNRSWNNFKLVGPDAMLAILMGILWMGAFALYGMSTTLLGSLGTSIGWGLFQIFMILTAMLSGLLAGEWNNAPGSSRLLLTSGLLCLTGATVLLANSR